MEIHILKDLIATTERLYKPDSITDEENWLADILSHSELMEDGDELWVIEENCGDGISTEQSSSPIKQGYYVYYCIAFENENCYKYFTDKLEALRYFRQIKSKEPEAAGVLLIDTSKGIIAAKAGSIENNQIINIKSERKIVERQRELYIHWVKRRYPIGVKLEVIKDIAAEIPTGTVGVVTRHVYPNILNITYSNGLQGELIPYRDIFRIVGLESSATIEFFPWRFHPTYLQVTLDQAYANEAEDLMEEAYQDWVKARIQDNSITNYEDFIINSLKAAGYNFTYGYGGKQ